MQQMLTKYNCKQVQQTILHHVHSPCNEKWVKRRKLGHTVAQHFDKSTTSSGFVEQIEQVEFGLKCSSINASVVTRCHDSDVSQ